MAISLLAPNPIIQAARAHVGLLVAHTYAVFRWEIRNGIDGRRLGERLQVRLPQPD
jgi:hypothetical protein